MPQPIAYNSGNPISGSIEKSTLSFTVEGAGSDIRDYDGSYAGVNWYSTIPPQEGKYVIISASNPPMIWVTADETDAELLITVNGLPDRYNQTLFTDTGSALSWLGSNAYFVSRETPDQINADSMVLNLDAGLESSYPRTGTTWYDLSGYNYTGSINNGPVFSPNGYFEFDATDDEIVINDVGSQLQDFGVTIDMKWNQNSIISSTAFGDIVCPAQLGIRDIGVGPTLYFQLRGSGIQFRWQRTGSDATISPSTPQETNRWNSYTGVLSSNGNSLYKNGELIGTTSHSKTFLPWYNNTIKLARNAYNNVLDGSISDAKVYNKALSLTEVKQNYYGGPIVTDGLVFAVDAGNLVSYESGSTTVYNLTGSNSGSLNNGTGYLPDNGGTFDFDGTDDTMTVKSNYTFSSGESYTYEVWFNPTTNNTTSGLIGGQNNPMLRWGQGSPSGKIYFFCGYSESPGYIGVLSNSILPVGEWHHAMATLDSVNKVGKLYINGEYETQFTWNTGTVSVPPSTILFNIRDSSNAYLGKISIGRVYNRTLSSDEVLQNYNAQKARFI